MKNIKLLVCDMAGTTILDNGGIVNQHFQKAFEVFKIPVTPEQINDVMGLAKPLAIRKILETTKYSNHLDALNALVVNIHSVFVNEMIAYYKDSLDFGEIPGTTDTFAKLKEKNILIALNSGFSYDIAKTIIDRLGWIENGLIDTFIAADQVKNGRPAPDMILEVMRRLAVHSPTEVAKVGDTASDLQEGANAGCQYVIGVLTGAYTREQLEKHPHTHIINSITDVLAII